MRRHSALGPLCAAVLMLSAGRGCTSNGNPGNADASNGSDDSGTNDNDGGVSDGGGANDGSSGNGDAGGNGDSGQSGQDGGPSSDATAGRDAQGPADLGVAEWCGALASPEQGGTCCTHCSGSDCAPNGCYGGRWCSAEPSMCYCVVPPPLCQQARGPGSSGGPLTCPSPGNYNHSTGSGCGTYRWNVKTASDNDIGSVGSNSQVATIADLVSRSAPASAPSNSRVPPAETTIFELRNVTLSYVRLASESDSDYHLVFGDKMQNTMIGEVPFPDCVAAGGPFNCSISRARAAMDTQFPNMITSTPFYPNTPVTVVGIGFWDTVHMQHGVAPNGIELHPVLAICFGLDCNPYP
jgi:hypothetical protein